jgi:hypothetical protein
MPVTRASRGRTTRTSRRVSLRPQPPMPTAIAAVTPNMKARLGWLTPTNPTSDALLHHILRCTSWAPTQVCRPRGPLPDRSGTDKHQDRSRAAGPDHRRSRQTLRAPASPGSEPVPARKPTAPVEVCAPDHEKPGPARKSAYPHPGLRARPCAPPSTQAPGLGRTRFAEPPPRAFGHPRTPRFPNQTKGGIGNHDHALRGARLHNPRHANSTWPLAGCPTVARNGCPFVVPATTRRSSPGKHGALQGFPQRPRQDSNLRPTA